MTLPPSRRRPFVAFACLTCLAGLTAVGVGGCAGFGLGSLSERRLVRTFGEAVEDGNEKAIRKKIGGPVAAAVERDPALVDALTELVPPVGEDFEIVAVEDLDADGEAAKLVTVEAGSPPKTIRYRLTEDAGGWVVAEVFTRHKQDGVVTTQAVSDLLGVATAARTFAADASVGGVPHDDPRLTPAFAAQLAALGEDRVAPLLRELADGAGGDGDWPEIELDDGLATVTLRRPVGRLTLELAHDGDAWRCDDVVSRPGGRDAAVSARRTAASLGVSFAFVDAYLEADKEALRDHATRRFFAAALEPGELAAAPLPRPDEDALGLAAAAADGDARHADGASLSLRDRTADVVLPADGYLLMLSLEADRDGETDPDAPAKKFRVAGVTLHDPAGGSERRLATMLVGEKVVRTFAAALADRDRGLLQMASTNDLNDGVWSRLDDETASCLLIPDLPAGAVTIESINYKGPVAEYTVSQGGRLASYIVRDEGGVVKVDDVLLARPVGPTGLKVAFDEVAPVQEFLAGVAAGDVGRIRGCCSADFNRLVWSQLDDVPAEAASAVTFLGPGPESSTETAGGLRLMFGDGDRGAAVTLVEERGRRLIDRFEAYDGTGPQSGNELKAVLRERVARGDILRVAEADTPEPGQIVPVSAEVPADE